MQTREELNTEIRLEILQELQKTNEASLVIDHHQLK